MDKYRRKVFDFLIQPENFGTVCELNEMFPEFMKILLIDLLKDVENYVREKIKDKKYWEVSSDYDDDWPWVSLEHKNFYNYFYVFIEFDPKNYTTDYGLYREIEDYEFLIYQKINREADKIYRISKDKGFKRNNYCLGWKLIDDFKNKDKAILLLPTSKEKLVKEYGDLLLEFADSIKDDVIKLAEFARKEFDTKYKSKKRK